MGIRTGSTSVRRPEALHLALLGQQPLGEVHALAQVAHLGAELLHLTRQLRAKRVELRPDVFREGRTALVPDPLGERPAHRREGQQEERPTPEDEDDGENPFHIHPVSLAPLATYGPNPRPPAPCGGTGPCTRPPPAPRAPGSPQRPRCPPPIRPPDPGR